MNCIACLILSTAVSSAGLGPAWNDDYAAALCTARCEGRPMVVVLENREKAKERAGSIFHVRHKLLTQFEVCRVDVGSDYGKKVASLYAPSELPYTVITDAECEQIVFRGVGERSINQWTETLKDHTDTKTGGKEIVKIDASMVIAASAQRTVVKPKEKPEAKTARVDRAEAFSHRGLAQARKAAESQDRRLLVYISMDNCPYCDKMQAETFTRSDVTKEIGTGFESVMIKKEQHEAFVAEHDVTIFPTTLVLSSNGKLLTKIDGFVDASEFKSRTRASQ